MVDPKSDLSPTSAELLLALRRYYGEPKYPTILSAASDAWDARQGGVALPGDDLAELGECWRIAMLAATRLDEDDPPPLRLVWRVRATSYFAQAGCRNGTAMMLLPSFFDAAKDPRTQPVEALAILDAMLQLVDDQEYPLRRLTVESSCHEKRGFFLTRLAMASDDPSARDAYLADAASAYQSAINVEPEPRRHLKIRAGAINVAFLRAGPKDRPSVINDLEALRAELARDNLAGDVLLVADDNLILMRAGHTNLKSYELT